MKYFFFNPCINLTAHYTESIGIGKCQIMHYEQISEESGDVLSKLKDLSKGAKKKTQRPIPKLNAER